MSSGSPRGTSIFQRICDEVMPIARPASITVRSMASNPAYAPARIEGMASRTNAATAASVLRLTPRSRTSSTMSPSEGRARAAPARKTANSRPRPVWPMIQPIGMAMTAAISTEPKVNARCWAMAVGSGQRRR